MYGKEEMEEGMSSPNPNQFLVWLDLAAAWLDAHIQVDASAGSVCFEIEYQAEIHKCKWKVVV